jgi:hypothetical protein
MSQVDRLKNRPEARPRTIQAMTPITGSFVTDLSGMRGSQCCWTDRDGRIVSRGVLTILRPWRLAAPFRVGKRKPQVLPCSHGISPRSCRGPEQHPHCTLRCALRIGQGPQARRRATAEWDRLYRLPPDLWRALLADPETTEGYHSKVYCWPGCWYWLGPISSSGHGRLRCGTRALNPERPETRVVASHVYGFQLSRGLLRPDPVTVCVPRISSAALTSRIAFSLGRP